VTLLQLPGDFVQTSPSLEASTLPFPRLPAQI